MKNIILFAFIAVALSACGTKSKIDTNFIADFTKALDTNFTEDQLNKMFRNYEGLLTPSSDVTQLGERIQGRVIKQFPLYDFKNNKIYKENIDDLLNSSNSNQRVLAYLVIAASDDTTKESNLLNKIKIEKVPGCLIWAGMGLLYMKTVHTTELFDFLVANEDFGDAHMLPLYLKLNKDSLQQTAYKRINSENIKAKILAVQSLAVTPLNPKTEELVKSAVQNWDFNIKGYAIYSVKELEIGNLLETFKALLDSTQTRQIALQALANSPTKADQDYLIEMVNKQDTVPKELLECFYMSKKQENIKYWLRLMYTKSIPANYHFFVFEQPLISSDSVLTEVHTALQKITNPNSRAELVRALKNRKDDVSVNIILSMLNSNNSTERYWAAWVSRDNDSPRLQEKQTKGLIEKILKDTK